MRNSTGASSHIDVRQVNPIGFAYHVSGGWAISGTGPADDRSAAGLQTARTLLGGAQPAVVSGTGARLVSRLRDFSGVLDHSGFHPGAADRARHLVTLAAGGVPLVLADPLGPDTAQLLAPDLICALEAATVDDLALAERRERVSIRQRRAAIRVAGLPAGLPTVSIVLAMHRADWLTHAIFQVNQQSYQPRELIVVLHGSRFPAGVRERIVREIEGPCAIVDVPAAACLGDALEAGVAVASGDVVTKMDDDDWYGSEHVWDVVAALGYSSAPLVGKSAEFVYLGELDITIRRFTGSAEIPSRTVGGSTLAIRRADLRDVGGWPRVPRAVDQRLVDAVTRSGGQVYRTHAHGYLVNRHGQGHTWVEHVDYFLAQSDTQRRGLDLAWAGCLT